MEFLTLKFNANTFLAYGVPATFILYYLYSSLAQDHQISWHDFRVNMLEKGQVDHLVVVNKTLVRVHLRPDAQPMSRPLGGGNTAGPPAYFFTIGSLESFERQLEEAQNELGIPSRDRIPVSYSNELSSLQLFLNMAPTLLLIGGLYYLSRRAAGGGGQAVHRASLASASPAPSFITKKRRCTQSSST